MALFCSRYQAYHVILPGNRAVSFHQGRYVTDDPVELDVLRDICKAESRSNRAVWEVPALDGAQCPHCGHTFSVTPSPLGIYEPPPLSHGTSAPDVSRSAEGEGSSASSVSQTPTELSPAPSKPRARTPRARR